MSQNTAFTLPLPDWQLAHIPAVDSPLGAADSAPVIAAGAIAGLDWRPVSLPLSVQTSPFGIPLGEIYRRDNHHQIEWMRGEYWLYRTKFTVPAAPAAHESLLTIRGIDYKAAIFIDGALALVHEGMFRAAEVPLGALAAGTEHEALIVIYPFTQGTPPYEHLKARYSLGKGWDFAPKIQSAGIWEGAEIVTRPLDSIATMHLVTQRGNAQRADIFVRLRLRQPVTGTAVVALAGVTTRFPLVDQADASIPITVPSPPLWHPNGSGEPNIVPLNVTIETASGSCTQTIMTGIRSVERVACEGQGQEDIALQLVVNGRKTFIKGVNWVPLDALPGTITRERYDTFLRQFRDGGVNLIRVWGGGLRERPDFYELCDQYGLMVMQEFPLACEFPSNTETFLRLLKAEATSIIADIAPHPCVVLWTGGNEHFHFWDAVDSGSDVMRDAAVFVRQAFEVGDDNREWRGGCPVDQPALLLMGDLVERLDGGRPYQPTSGMEGQGEAHGIWNWDPEIGDHRFRDFPTLYKFWLAADQHLYSEASVSSIANLATIRDVLGEAAPQLPEKTDPIWQMHHAFRAAWDQKDDLWLDIPSTEALFGKAKSLDDLVFTNQWMQGEGGRFLAEEIRRKRGHTAGIIWWGANEPWPGLAGNALIDWYGRPKLGWRMYTNAFRPLALSLRYDNCVCRAVKPQLWITSDLPGAFEGSYRITTRTIGGTEEVVTGRVSCASDSSAFVRTLPRTRLHAGTRLHVRCELLDSAGTIVHGNDYFFASDEDAVPFDAEIVTLMREICAA